MKAINSTVRPVDFLRSIGSSENAKTLSALKLHARKRNRAQLRMQLTQELNLMWVTRKADAVEAATRERDRVYQEIMQRVRWANAIHNNRMKRKAASIVASKAMVWHPEPDYSLNRVQVYIGAEADVKVLASCG